LRGKHEVTTNTGGKMRNLKQLARGAVTGGLMSIGVLGMAAAQTDSTVRLDVNTVTDELGLNEQTSSELAPLLERLNVAFERREEHWRQGDEIFDEIANTYDEIAETLSATELREFHWLLRETAYGLRAGRPYGRYYDGRMRGLRDRRPAFDGRRGFSGRGRPVRGMRGGMGWDTRPGWRPDDF
jgi:hypothetical protein